MDLPQRALQTNEELFWNFKLVFEILAENQKNIQTNTESVNIDQSEMY